MIESVFSGHHLSNTQVGKKLGHILSTDCIHGLRGLSHRGSGFPLEGNLTYLISPENNRQLHSD